MKIPIAIIPFDRNEMECLIHFHDPEVGEFLYRIDLTVALPTATETLTFRTSPNVPAQRNLCVDLGSRIREKAVIQALEHSVRIAKQMSADHPVSIEDSELKRYRPPVSDSLKYSIQYESPYWTGPSEIRVNSEHGKKWMPAGYSNVEQSNADTVILFKAKVCIINRVIYQFYRNMQTGKGYI